MKKIADDGQTHSKKIKGHSISLEKFQLKLIIWVTAFF